MFQPRVLKDRWPSKDTSCFLGFLRGEVKLGSMIGCQDVVLGCFCRNAFSHLLPHAKSGSLPRAGIEEAVDERDVGMYIA